ncbi:HU family DNA-binding protein [Pseudophaeobacter arcticus]|jgi:nucleoid DNA-binding protein|uniref:HU family DNA-binding protein n=1 Tax=Pseudophaeobacter arcticus TaxID=385492 RepID=UPI000411B801|nr:HU family DNA-binding protein [Pseudophaeobacter arcticus]
MSKKITKQDLIRSIAEELGQTQEAVGATIEALIGQITNAAMASQEVSLHGFGTFKRSERAARAGRNPATGVSIQIEASSSLGFKPAKAVKDKLNS